MGVIHIATGVVDNALWGMCARWRKNHYGGGLSIRPIICTRAIQNLTLALGRTCKRHWIPVRPHLAIKPPRFPDILT